jgi:thiamine monophosphate synthase
MTKAQKILFAVAGGLGAVALSPFLPAVAIGGASLKAILLLAATFAGGVAVKSDAIHGKDEK